LKFDLNGRLVKSQRTVRLLACVVLIAGCGGSGSGEATIDYNGEDSCVEIAEELGCPAGGVITNCYEPFDDSGQDIWIVGTTCPGGNDEWALRDLFACDDPAPVCN
jgi:hypothetical protein